MVKIRKFSSKIRNKKDTTFIQYSIRSPSQIIRQGKKRKVMQMAKEEVKLSLFADDILYVEILKTPPKIVRINKFNKSKDTKSIYINLLHFSMSTNYHK